MSDDYMRDTMEDMELDTRNDSELVDVDEEIEIIDTRKPVYKVNKTSVEKNNEGKIKKVVTFDDSPDDVLLWSKDESIELHFDEVNFLDLPMEIFLELDRYQKRDWRIARDHHEALEKQKNSDWPDVKVVRQLRPLTGSSADSIKRAKQTILEHKPNVHVTFKRPDEVADSEAQGYFKEMTVTKFQGKPDLIAMSIPKERYQEHLDAISEKSRKYTHSIRDDVKEKASGNISVVDNTTKNKEAL